MLAAMVSPVAIMWGIPLLATAVGLWGQVVFMAILLLGLAWFLYLSVKSLTIACPRCRRSVFIRGFGWSAPWPARRCGKCGRDLTVP